MTHKPNYKQIILNEIKSDHFLYTSTIGTYGDFVRINDDLVAKIFRLKSEEGSKKEFENLTLATNMSDGRLKVPKPHDLINLGKSRSFSSINYDFRSGLGSDEVYAVIMAELKGDNLSFASKKQVKEYRNKLQSAADFLLENKIRIHDIRSKEIFLLDSGEVGLVDWHMAEFNYVAFNSEAFTKTYRKMYESAFKANSFKNLN